MYLFILSKSLLLLISVNIFINFTARMVCIIIRDDKIRNSFKTQYSKAKSYIHDSMQPSLTSDYLQLAWILSHIVTLVSTISYCLLNPSHGAISSPPWYFLVLFSTIITYSIVVYKNYTADEDALNGQVERLSGIKDGIFRVPLADILKSENTHLLIYAFLWLVTPKCFLKLLPFASYSLLNIGNYFILEKYPEAPLSIALLPFAIYLECPVLSFAAHIDLAVIGCLIFETYMTETFYSLIIYGFVWGLRFEYSDASRYAVSNVLSYMDKLSAIVGICPGFKTIPKHWATIKKMIIDILSLDKDYTQVPLHNKQTNEESSLVITEGVVKSKVPSEARKAKRRKLNKME